MVGGAEKGAKAVENNNRVTINTKGRAEEENENEMTQKRNRSGNSP